MNVYNCTIGKLMRGATDHFWILSNDPLEKFARMKTMKVTFITPFQLAKEE
jgi:hypothetical protein